MGADMGFNAAHHHHPEATTAVIHIHAGGNKHIHKEKTVNHSHAESHHHDQANSYASGNVKDNCCNDKVIKFEQLDKSVAHTFSLIHPVFFTAFLSTFYYTALQYSFEETPSVRYFVRSYHPPIPDIRVAIQSFQI